MFMLTVPFPFITISFQIAAFESAIIFSLLFNMIIHFRFRQVPASTNISGKSLEVFGQPWCPINPSSAGSLTGS